MIFRCKLWNLSLFLELFDYTQCHESDDTLAVGGMLPELNTAVGIFVCEALTAEFDGNGLCVLSAGFEMVLQVVEFEISSQVLNNLYDLLCNTTGVETLLTLRRQSSECLSESWVLEDFTWTRGSHAILCGGVFLEHLCEVGGSITKKLLLSLPLSQVSPNPTL